MDTCAGGDKLTNHGKPGDGFLSLSKVIIFIVFSVIFLNRFGFNIGNFSPNFSIFGPYIVIVVLLFHKMEIVDPVRLVLFVALVFSAVSSLLLNVEHSSIPSLALLFVLYFPFIFTVAPSPDLEKRWHWTLNVYSRLALLCAVAGIVQFVGQFAIRAAWWMDFTPLIPLGLRAVDAANTVIPIGSFYKSNGFFLREPSAFSQIMAIALLIEIVVFKRLAHLLVLAAGILLSYSGTGLILLFFGMLFPLRMATVGRLLVIAAGAMLIYAVLGDALNLSATLDRVNEFQTDGSSAYFRFIAPMMAVTDTVNADLVTFLFGHGPGSMSGQIEKYGTTSTWAKLFFEYGLTGSVSLLALLIHCLRQFRPFGEIQAGLFISWLILGGHLLAPHETTLIFIFAAMWPNLVKRTTLQNNMNPFPATLFSPISPGPHRLDNR